MSVRPDNTGRRKLNVTIWQPSLRNLQLNKNIGATELIQSQNVFQIFGSLILTELPFSLAFQQTIMVDLRSPLRLVWES